MFSINFQDSLTLPLRISSALCSSGSFLILFTSLITSYWVTERSPQGLIHTGLWEMCLEPSCHYYSFNVPEYLHVTRGFIVLAFFCGLISLVCICLSFEKVNIGSIYFMVVAGIFSFSTAFFTLIAIAVFTAVQRSREQYMKHLILFGSSYGLCWASVSLYMITGVIIMITHRSSFD